LIEIMVALAIITIALGAIIESTSSSTSNATHLRDKTIASWVAMNQIALTRAKRTWGTISNTRGTVEMAGQEWQWKMQIKSTEEKDIRRLLVDVSSVDNDQAVLASREGYLLKP
jgi:general secretion pathway protein I